MSVVTQLERYIYVFCGRYGVRDVEQPSIINIETLHTIECFDTIEQKWEEYVIKSCHKVSKCYSPGTVQVDSLRRKNPGILFFGGKVQFEKKNTVKINDQVYLLFPQNKNKSRILNEKYFVKGQEMRIKAPMPEILQKKKSKDKDKVIEVELFNGNIE